MTGIDAAAASKTATDDASTLVRVAPRGRVAVITIDNPPVNALSRQLRADLLRAMTAASGDEQIEAVLIHCAGRTFCAGADIREFDRPVELPLLPEVVAAIDSSPKPVIAAIHGTALGGGLELALACHFRVAAATAKLGLPEVKLGLLPGSGGTQRLPRLIGAQRALEMMTSGAPIGAPEALAHGLIDEIVEGELVEHALRFADERRGAAAPRTAAREDKLAPARADPDLFDRFLTANARKFRCLDAPAAIVDVVRKGVALPFDEAVANERAAFLRLREGAQSKALRHLFLAEREAAKVPELRADTPTRPIGTVGVVGAGTMGSGIAIALLQAGFTVVLSDTADAALDRGVGAIAKALDRNVEAGRMSADAREQATAALSTTLTYQGFADADLVIEAAFEDLTLKKDIFSRLGAAVREDALLATNTSYGDVNTIAAAASNPERVLGIHFFSPANVMKLAEVVRADKTSPEALASALRFAKRLGKIPVVAGNCPGFIGNRMMAVRRREADRLILEGATPWEVDRVMVEFGMPMGPFQISDLSGLDLGWTRETSTGSTIRELLCEHERRGQKTGAGFYDYDAQRRPAPSALTEQLIGELSARQSVDRRRIASDEILERLLYPMINEGAKILEEGIALRSSDIDVVWVHGFGWPSWRGGPMFYADDVGLGTILDRLRQMQKRLGDEYRPSKLLEHLAEQHGHFSRAAANG